MVTIWHGVEADDLSPETLALQPLLRSSDSA